MRAPPPRAKERTYQKQVTQEGDEEKYGELKFKIGETICAAYDKAEMRKAKILMISSSDIVSTPKSQIWPDVVLLAEEHLYWMQSISMAIGI